MLVGLGLDIIEVSRIRRVLRTFKGRFRDRIFTPAEIAYCQSKPRPSLSYAARWAAKEAALKALGCGWDQGIAWTDLEVGHAPNGAPTMTLHGRAAELWAQLGSPTIHITLTHTRTTAAAVVMLEARTG
ncbi:MAG: Holo-[acyl-carrier-protein] synthase [bacterium]|nr:Holo-[acyl-carrier-protein] synthase [bacterium]